LDGDDERTPVDPAQHPTDAHDDRPATRDARSALRGWLDRLPVDATHAPEPRAWVASLALDGVWLVLYQEGDPFTLEEGEEFLRAVSAYTGIEPQRGVELTDALLDEEPFRDERPLVDAVLRVAAADGADAITFRRVAELSDRSESALRSMFGDVAELVDDVAMEIAQAGFDDLSPLRLDPSAPAVAANLAAFGDSRRAAALLRLYLLGGVPRTDPVLARDAVAPAALRAVREEDAPSDLLLAALAADAWRSGQHVEALRYPGLLPTCVRDELARLVG